MKFPNTVDRNTYKTFITPLCRTVTETAAAAAVAVRTKINALDLKWDSNAPETLRVLCIRTIAKNWCDRPLFRQIPLLSDRDFLLDILDVDLPLDRLAANIREDVFWRRCFMARWNNFYPHSIEPRPWISLYMERHLVEYLESLKPVNWDAEHMQQMITVCGPYVQCLQIGQLLPAMDEEYDHIDLEMILAGLPQLRKLDISYALKSIGTDFFLGCSNISPRDIKWLTQGFVTCQDLVEFSIHSTKLDADHLRAIARSLATNCTKLELISMTHCNIIDHGLVTFICELTSESFSCLKHVQLADNKITQIGALYLSEVISLRPIESLSLRLNAIGSNGAATILLSLSRMPIHTLDISGCAIDANIGELLCLVLSETQSLQDINLSSNYLGQALGAQIASIPFTRQLRELDLRNTGIAPEDKCQIDAAILENRLKS